ncbi:MAG: type I glutamate--ammonia ligase [Anaerolineales bacterium]|jgi:glutamine synthetase|nr:type I glutamate--ammonia ligase [Anaerolineales bacterium]
MSTEIIKRAHEDDVKFICLQFTDVTGVVKSVDIPVNRLEVAIEEGIWFDGSSVEGFARIQESDMRLMPDVSTYCILPWSQAERRRARIFCDIFLPDGTPFPGDPRGVLKRALSRVAERGWQFNIGPEPEFFLLRRNGPDAIHPVPHDVGGYFDFSASDEAQRVRTSLMAALASMGLEIEMGHHEVALGQHEIDFRYTDALEAADNVVTLKYTIRALAAKEGLIATFMPKPIFGMNGSGMHTHQSIFDLEGKNLFFNAEDENYLSSIAYGFIAGQIEHARALSAIVAPTVNSYKRIVPGYEAPVYVCWAQINRSAMIRIPSYSVGRETSIRVELRFPDPSCNPYLAFAAMLAAGLDGIDRDIACPPPVNNLNIYEMEDADLLKSGISQLPGSLAEALQELEGDSVIKDSLGMEAYTAFTRAKQAEWDEYRTRVMDWEVEYYLETA